MDEKLTPEELFNSHKHLAKTTVYHMFKEPHGIAKKHKIELDDLIQYALEGLWNAALKYDPNKGERKFSNFAIYNMRWNLSNRLKRDCRVLSFQGTGLDAKYIRSKLKFISLDDAPAEDESDNSSYHELIAGNYNLEGEAMGTLLERIIKDKYQEKDLIALKRLNQGAYLREIGSEYGISRERVRQRVEKLKQRLREELLG